MDQNVRLSPSQATAQRSNDGLRDAEIGKPAYSSAMVIVLGLVALVSMAFGFVIGLLV